jgi:hypothetical protein
MRVVAREANFGFDSRWLNLIKLFEAAVRVGCHSF